MDGRFVGIQKNTTGTEEKVWEKGRYGDIGLREVSINCSLWWDKIQ